MQEIGLETVVCKLEKSSAKKVGFETPYTKYSTGNEQLKLEIE